MEKHFQPVERKSRVRKKSIRLYASSVAMSLPSPPGWFERSKSSTVDTFESTWAIYDDNCLFLVFEGLFDACLYLIVVKNAA